MTKVVALTSGLSEPSSSTMLGEQVLAAVRAQLPDAQTEIVSLREHAHDVTDAMLTGFPNGRLRPVVDAVTGADALVVVTPIFKASYPGLFKAFVDGLEPDALTGKPVLLAATGGTARHSLAIDFALRPLFAYLQAMVVPTGVFASPHDWGSEGKGALTARIDRAVGELTSVLSGGGTGRGPSDDFDLFSDTFLAASRPPE